MSNKDYKQIILDGLLKKYNNRYAKNITTNRKYSLQGTTQGRYLTGGVPPVRFSM